MRRAVLILVLLVVASACQPVTTEPDDDPGIPVATPLDAVSNKRRVQEIVSELDRIHGESVRAFARERTISPNVLQLVRAAFGDEQSRAVLGAFADQMQIRFRDVAAQPGDPITTVRDVVIDRPDCIVIRAQHDFRPIRPATRPLSLKESFDMLVPLEAGRDATGINTTGWRFETVWLQDDGPPPELVPCPSGPERLLSF